jgi:hypothetical protein
MDNIYSDITWLNQINNNKIKVDYELENTLHSIGFAYRQYISQTNTNKSITVGLNTDVMVVEAYDTSNSMLRVDTASAVASTLTMGFDNNVANDLSSDGAMDNIIGHLMLPSTNDNKNFEFNGETKTFVNGLDIGYMDSFAQIKDGYFPFTSGTKNYILILKDVATTVEMYDSEITEDDIEFDCRINGAYINAALTPNIPQYICSDELTKPLTTYYLPVLVNENQAVYSYASANITKNFDSILASVFVQQEYSYGITTIDFSAYKNLEEFQATVKDFIQLNSNQIPIETRLSLNKAGFMHPFVEMKNPGGDPSDPDNWKTIAYSESEIIGFGSEQSLPIYNGKIILNPHWSPVTTPNPNLYFFEPGHEQLNAFSVDIIKYDYKKTLIDIFNISDDNLNNFTFNILVNPTIQYAVVGGLEPKKELVERLGYGYIYSDLQTSYDYNAEANITDPNSLFYTSLNSYWITDPNVMGISAANISSYDDMRTALSGISESVLISVTSNDMPEEIKAICTANNLPAAIKTNVLVMKDIKDIIDNGIDFKATNVTTNIDEISCYYQVFKNKIYVGNFVNENAEEINANLGVNIDSILFVNNMFSPIEKQMKTVAIPTQVEEYVSFDYTQNIVATAGDETASAGVKLYRNSDGTIEPVASGTSANGDSVGWQITIPTQRIIDFGLFAKTGANNMSFPVFENIYPFVYTDGFKYYDSDSYKTIPLYYTNLEISKQQRNTYPLPNSSSAQDFSNAKMDTSLAGGTLEYQYVYNKTNGVGLLLDKSAINTTQLLNWVDSSSAGKRFAEKGYSQNDIVKAIKSLNLIDTAINNAAQYDRMQRIKENLARLRQDKFVNILLLIITVIGVLIMIYAVCLGVAFFVDYSNPLSSALPTLHFVSFGQLIASDSPNELRETFTDKRDKRKVVGILGILVVCLSLAVIGLLLINSIFVLETVSKLYVTVTGLFM